MKDQLYFSISLYVMCRELFSEACGLGDFEDLSRKCPEGWTCTGSATVMRMGTGNGHGNGYLNVGEDRSQGTAVSDFLFLPQNPVQLVYLRAGGADAPSGLSVHSKTGETLCQSSVGTNTDTFFEATCDLNGRGGQMVRIEVKDVQSSSWGKVSVDYIRLKLSDGSRLPLLKLSGLFVHH